MYPTLESPQGAKIILNGKEFINMASNNYLGLAGSYELINEAKGALDLYGVGAVAGRNIVGNFPIHDELEEELARFKGVEATLTFNCGVSANAGVIPVLVGKGDTIYSDELNHGSLIDGCRLSGAKIKVYKHKDISSLRSLLEEESSGKRLIITDGVFSMDGDLAPLSEIFELSKEFNSRLLVDDSHGDGVMGVNGRGTISHFALENKGIIETGSLSKAFGSAGGFVAGSKKEIEEIRTRARTFIFTASPMAPVLAAAALKAIKLIESDKTIHKRLWERREYFVKRLTDLGFDVSQSKTPIVPIILGDEDVAIKAGHALYKKGIFAQAIKFPLVAKDRARLRMIVCADHSEEDLDYVAKMIYETINCNAE